MTTSALRGGALKRSKGIQENKRLMSMLSSRPVFDYSDSMSDEPSALASWTPEQVALGKRWVETWRLAGAELERIHRKEIRELDAYRAIALLCGPADYTLPPRAPKPFSGLVDQQRWFTRAARS
jgi:hypothetical protein